ncbi:aldo/keto reductase [Halonatronum saccharophilum]|uniref:aldo/keto reductase n=1 Tax=Halonatronum saccharophilum TaxID=150060 RepID=UPI000483BD8A|nr:aldo/keto reductase [Halonatronum saccharophilum]
MKYRKFGKLDWKPSALGFGAMRFPTDKDGNIKEEEAIEMIRYSIDNGVNYVDTAWPYHNGESEPLVAKALKDGYRKKVKVATKLPSWLINNKDDMEKYLDKQLKKLGLDSIDFYLLHALNRKYWDNYKKLGVFEWIKKVKKEGKIKYIGFSFHDDYKLFEEIINDYAGWDFCQIQYNYLDIDFQAGKKGLDYAAQRDIGVIIMEPLKGGKLANTPPPSIDNIYQKSNTERSYVDLALQWLWNQGDVGFLLSGMSNLQQVKENVESASNSGVNNLSSEEIELVEEISKRYRELAPIGCTRCEYCIPCPVGVNIPNIFNLYNEGKIYDKEEENTKEYNNIKPDERASACVECGSCEDICPQNLQIIKLLKKIDNYFNK